MSRFAIRFERWSLLSIGCLAVAALGCQPPAAPTANSEAATASVPASATKLVLQEQVVDAACGECQFGMEGKSCDLAVRTDAGSFFVSGTAIDDHGDAHAADGLCNCVRKAKVTGQVENGKFVAKSFELLPKEDATTK